MKKRLFGGSGGDFGHTSNPEHREVYNWHSVSPYNILSSGLFLGVKSGPCLAYFWWNETTSTRLVKRVQVFLDGSDPVESMFFMTLFQ